MLLFPLCRRSLCQSCSAYRATAERTHEDISLLPCPVQEVSTGDLPPREREKAMQDLLLTPCELGTGLVPQKLWD